MTERHRYRLDPARMTYEEAGRIVNAALDGQFRGLSFIEVARRLGTSDSTLYAVCQSAKNGDPYGRRAHRKLSDAIRALAAEGGAK